MDQLLDQAFILRLISDYGYFALFAVIALECAGLPLPGETMLIGAAIYAGETGGLGIGKIIFASGAGAVVGDNIGYWIGRRFGSAFLERYAAKFGISAQRLLLSRYLFARYGGSIVFFGRFVTVLRLFAALIAGANLMAPARFFVFNAAGGVVWASVFGFGGFYFTAAFRRLEGPIASFALFILIVALAFLWRFVKGQERRLLAEASAWARITQN